MVSVSSYRTDSRRFVWSIRSGLVTDEPYSHPGSRVESEHLSETFEKVALEVLAITVGSAKLCCRYSRSGKKILCFIEDVRAQVRTQGLDRDQLDRSLQNVLEQKRDLHEAIEGLHAWLEAE